MNRVMRNCGLLEVRTSPIEGFGVFAKGDIPAKTVLEEVPFVLFPRYINLAKNIYDLLRNGGWVSHKELHMENLRENLQFKEPERYYFKWHPPVQIDGDSMFTVLPLGCGPLYNSSNTNNNADWKMLKDTFIFTAEKDIKKDEEIKTFYGYFMGDDGTIFNCEAVFHLAIDMITNADGKPEQRVKSLRFGNLDSFNAQRTNPAAHRLNAMIGASVDGVTVRRANILQPTGDVVASMEFPLDMSLTALYRKLSEARMHPAPLVALKFDYIDKTTLKPTTEEVIWKK